jgi:hypothetical protein
MSPTPLSNHLGITTQSMRRFLSKIAVEEGGCWRWTASKAPDGYGRMSLREITKQPVQAHSLSYRLAVGAIPKGNHLHHKREAPTNCIGPSCVNPAHMECITPSRHIDVTPCPSGLNRKKTHCKYGHEFTPENTYLVKNGRACKACVKRKDRARTERRRANRKPKELKQFCIKGHPLSGDNLYLYKAQYGVGRGCKECSRNRTNAYRLAEPERVRESKRKTRENQKLKSQQAFYDQFLP